MGEMVSFGMTSPSEYEHALITEKDFREAAEKALNALPQRFKYFFSRSTAMDKLAIDFFKNWTNVIVYARDGSLWYRGKKVKGEKDCEI